MPNNDLIVGCGRSSVALEFAAWVVLACAVGLLLITAWCGAEQVANWKIEHARISAAEGRE